METPPPPKPARHQWLLVIPFIALLWMPFYSFRDPEILDFPFFYWYQFVWVFLTSFMIYLAYRGRHGN